MKTNKLLKTIILLLICTQATFASTSSITGMMNEVETQEVQASDVAENETDWNEGLLANSPELDNLIDDAYTSLDLIDYALESRLEYQYGDRIQFLQEKAKEIVAKSEGKTEELLLRLTLKRTTQIGQGIVTIMGKNNQENLRWLSNFYKDGFEMAASLTNGNYSLISTLQDVGEYNSEAQYLTSAEFGRRHALRIWNYTSGLSSDATKSVLLVKLVSYLGQDLKNDLRRRVEGIAKSIADVYHLQKSRTYKKVIASLKNNMIPARTDIAKLRRTIYTLIQKMNQRF